MESDYPVILFDGICNLCNVSVQRIIKKEKRPLFKFASIQSDFGQKLLANHNVNPKMMDSIILIQNAHVYQKTRAIFRIAFRMKMPYPLIYLFWPIPYFIRDLFYSFIATNRYKWFGKTEECWIPTPEITERFLD